MGWMKDYDLTPGVLWSPAQKQALVGLLVKAFIAGILFGSVTGSAAFALGRMWAATK